MPAYRQKVLGGYLSRALGPLHGLPEQLNRVLLLSGIAQT
jgi:hypothetical protein